MAPIPLCIVEEHNEAFLAWNAAMRLGFVPPSGNTLLHVDEHADMAAPHFRSRLEGHLDDLDRLRAFVSSEMAIYDFIVPAVHQGLLAEVHWLNHRADPPVSEDLVVWATGEEEQILATRPAQAGGRPGRPFRLVSQTIRAPFRPSGATILDVDLDYFSCDQAEHRSWRIEITPAASADFAADDRHFLKLLLGSRATVLAEDGRHYIVVRGYRERQRCPLRVTELMIKLRLVAFEHYLASQAVAPVAITVARSRLTGYTPEDQWQFIEQGVLGLLGRLYPVRIVTTDALLAEAKAAA